MNDEEYAFKVADVCGYAIIEISRVYLLLLPYPLNINLRFPFFSRTLEPCILGEFKFWYFQLTVVNQTS
jgi:hypothetical protein